MFQNVNRQSSSPTMVTMVTMVIHVVHRDRTDGGGRKRTCIGFTKTVMTVKGWRFNEVRTVYCNTSLDSTLSLEKGNHKIGARFKPTQVEMSFVQRTHLINQNVISKP